MAQSTKVSEKKLAEVELLKKYIDQYNCIGLVHMDKISAQIIQTLRKKLRGKCVIRLSKKRIQQRALRASKKKNLDQLADTIDGSSAIVFTNMDPLDLRKILEENKQNAPPKGGDIAPKDIVVPAGNTGIPPGPIISELNEELRVRTRIQDGTIWIQEEKVTHKTGDLISAKAAQLLARLDIKPIEVMLDLYSAWENDELLPREVLYLDIDAKRGEISTAVASALQLAIACGVIDDLTMPSLLQKAVREANALALELPVFIPDLAELYIRQAVTQARALEVATLGEEGEDAADEAESPEEEEKEPDKEEPTGLAGLFD
ncbi:MAG: 50S ribosomal protein L10 [Promethearchaeota archaeon]